MTTINPLSVSELQAKLATLNNDPTASQRIFLEGLDNYYKGITDTLDPTNPFIYLMGVSQVNASINLQESVELLRDQYPSLAINYTQLFKHMSDRDYLGVYSNPSLGKFRFMINLNSFDSVAVYDPLLNCKKITIARNTEITFQNTTFSLQYPIDIKKFLDDRYEVNYVGDKLSPIQSISSNLIKSTKITKNNIEYWLTFDLELFQLSSITAQFSVDPTSIFKEYIDIPLNLRYYYARVYTLINNEWVEIKTTITKQVYDSTVATAILKPTDTNLEIYIPTSYVLSGKVSNLIRVDVFLTKGQVNIDPSDVMIPDGYSLEFKNNDNADNNVYVSALNSLPIYAYAVDKISGGYTGFTFQELRNKVIFNSIGKQTLPITNAHLENYVSGLGYKLNMNLNTLTNRLFTISKPLAQPINTDIIKPAQPTLIQFSTSLDKLLNHPNVIVNGPLFTLKSNSYFKNDNAKLSLLPETMVDNFKLMLSSDLVTLINSGSYFYNPFYYVVDTSKEILSIRPYHLDQPSVNNKTYVLHNITSNIDVTTDVINVSKMNNGYKITISTISTNTFKLLNNDNVGAQLSFNPVNSTNFVSVEGTLLYNDVNGERVYSFDLITNYEIDADNYISITNGYFDTGFNEKVQINLLNKMYITYYTLSIPPSYAVQPNDSLINQSITGNDLQKMLITRDSFDLTIGYHLDGLWSKFRSYLSTNDYDVYTQDIYQTYENDVLDINPDNNTPIFYDTNNKPYIKILHKKGDNVLDDQNNPIILHHAGDVILDSNNLPTTNSYRNKIINFSLLMIDACYLLATDDIYIDYVKEITNNLLEYITVDVPYLNDLVLEKTKIYYAPFITKGNTNILTVDDDVINIDKEQNIKVDVYVPENTYDNFDSRKYITKVITQKVVDALSQNQIVIKDIEDDIVNTFQNSITTVSVSGLGGSYDFKALNVINNNEQLSIKYMLTLLNDGTLTVSLGVEVNFLLYNG